MGCGCGGGGRRTFSSVYDGGSSTALAAPGAGQAPEYVWEVRLPNGEVEYRDTDAEAYQLVRRHGGGGMRLVPNPG